MSRESFEAAAIELFPEQMREYMFERNLSGRYSSLEINAAWLAYQAAEREVVRACAEIVVDVYEDLASDQIEEATGAAVSADAIRAAFPEHFKEGE